MSKRDLLIEIGTEEMPARFIGGAIEQFRERVEKWLESRRIAFDGVRTYETPRRLAVLAEGVAEKQADRNEEARGPARKIAQDENGNWTKAAEGFAKSNGVTTADLFFREFNGVEYVYAKKNEAGRETFSLLPELAEVITGMHFPKNMRWGAYDLKYVRPIRWLVALYGSDVVELEVAGVRAGRTTQGHRFLGGAVELTEPSDYAAKLAEQYVIADPADRRERIVAQLRALEAENGWRIPIDEGLLDEVVHLVEYPTALYGSFEPAFLQIPRDVLVTSMREHQRYFPVEDGNGQLLPHFVTVRNGNDRAIENVIKGNEKVLRARLSDARFFYDEDQKLDIDGCLNRLESIVFHEKLGTLGDKVRRIQSHARAITGMLQLDSEARSHIDRIARIAKFDLVTHMVGEFPELQGIMGEDYARLKGEPETVARGIFEHYLPRFAGDRLPASDEGAVVSIADKLDTLVGCFAIGIIPTGSQDPYGLRRQASGIVQILLDRSWQIALGGLIEAVLAAYREQGVELRETAEVNRDLLDFFAQRLKTVLTDAQIRYDVIDAVLAVDMSNVPLTVQKARVLQDAVQKDEWKAVVEQFNRAYNLAQKADSTEVTEEHFQVEAERRLYQAHLSAVEEIDGLYERGELARVLEVLATLKEPIETFFADVMVMAEDPDIRRNRLALLARVSGDVQRFADFTKLVFA